MTHLPTSSVRIAGCKMTHLASPGGGVLPYMGYIGMCGPKGYGFSAVLVINRVWFLHSSLDIFKKKPLFHHYRKENQQRPVTNYVYSNLTLVWGPFLESPGNFSGP